MAQLVTETYANALFEVGVETGNLEALYTDFKDLVEVFKSEKDFFELYKTPQIVNDEKKQIVDQVFGGQIEKELNNFLKVLIDKRRTYYVTGIFDSFEKMYKAHYKMATALVKSVHPLEDDQVAALKAKLGDLTGLTIEIENVIDPTLVGGVMIQIGDRVIDHTLKRKLQTIKDSLKDLVI